MAFNGSGLFVIDSSGQPVVAGTSITASVHNALTADLATGLSNCITKDGQQTVTANIPMATYKITGLGAATARTDAASLATIQDGTGVYVGTVGGTADVITLTPSPAITAYAAGQTFRFIASGANTTNVTVNVSGLGARAITKNGTTALVAGDIPSGTMVEITYDGTRFILGTLGAATYLQKSGGTLTGDLLFTDATYDIGKSGATRPRDVFASRNVAIGGTLSPSGLIDASAAGAGQLKFPATQNASSDANTLDDYEEGTWTPTVGGTATYTVQTGYYTKIGRTVLAHCNLIISSIGTGSTSIISGLPFTAGGVGWTAPLFWSGGAVSPVYAVGKLLNATVVIQGATAASASLSSLALMGNGTQIAFMAMYQV